MKKLKCSVCGAEWMLPDEVVLKNCPNPDCLALLDEEGQNDHWAYHLSQDINHYPWVFLPKFPIFVRTPVIMDQGPLHAEGQGLGKHT